MLPLSLAIDIIYTPIYRIIGNFILIKSPKIVQAGGEYNSGNLGAGETSFFPIGSALTIARGYGAGRMFIYT